MLHLTLTVHGCENMGIEIDVKRKFVVNGKEYASLDELPDDIRRALQKTLKEDKSKVEVNIDTSIVFNGKGYNGVDQMPAETRQAYEKVMKAVGTGDFASHALDEIGGAPGKKASFSFNAKAPGATFSFSLGPVFAVLILIALAAGFYFLFM